MITQTIIANEEMTLVKNDRAFFETLGQNYPVHPQVTVTETSVANVKSFWFKPKNEKGNNLVIYLHGGGFMMGNINSHKAMVSHFANALGSTILFVEYSLAPEHPFPTAKNEVLAVYEELLERFPEHRISFIGDSAGGGLTVTTIYDIIQAQLKLPATVSLISPWLNMKANTEAYKTRKELDPIINEKEVRRYINYYAAEAGSLADPDEMDFDKFPPVFLLVGTNEILFDDAKNFYAYIKTVQPKAQFKEYENQLHVWPLADINSEKAKAALQDIVTFVNN
ncbi:alpha/beta hydrolase [Chitinophaga sp. Hz27]|uniref:alpha/beta hydrolase n=1 Tax=Chitinophaga sp. Hz27 TaxID=3347169 RepID=UPI0035E2B672